MASAVSSVSEYVRYVLELCSRWRDQKPNAEIWYRGHFKQDYELIPSAYRDRCDLNSMFLTFKADAVHFAPELPDSDWEWYYAAQHYGLPTTLLDWTEDPLAALYFAIRDMHPEHKKLPEDADRGTPHVWMVDAAELNLACAGVYATFTPANSGNEFTRHWLPEDLAGMQSFRDPQQGSDATNEKPIAIYPIRRTRRIIAQRGCFTAHGTERSSLDSQVGAQMKRLEKIEVQSVDAIDRELLALGLDKYRYFPELHTLTEHIVRRCPPG